VSLSSDFVPSPVQIAAGLAAVAPAAADAHAAALVEAARLERAKARSVMFVTPIARDPTVQYLVSMLRTANVLTRLGIRHCCEFLVGSSNLPRARNGLAARFLASDFDVMFMIDDDMGWSPGAVVRLLASNQPFVAAVGRKKSADPNDDPRVWCAQWLSGSAPRLDDMGAVEARRVGAAFVALDRSVLARLAAAHPEWKRDGHDDMNAAQRAAYHQFFQFNNDNDEVGEDYLFCDRWRALGGEVWVDPSIELAHVGVKEHVGRLLDILHPSPVRPDPSSL
jgi:hypothetical protein